MPEELSVGVYIGVSVDEQWPNKNWAIVCTAAY